MKRAISVVIKSLFNGVTVGLLNIFGSNDTLFVIDEMVFLVLKCRDIPRRVEYRIFTRGF